MKERKIEIQFAGLPAIHSPEAERAVLGAMLTEPLECVDAAAAALTVADFFQPAHRTLFAELAQMRDAGKAIDPSTLLLHLEDRKLSDAVGGARLLGELSASVVSVLTFPTHLQTVRDKALLRELQRVGALMAHNAHERQHEAAAVLDEAEQLVFAIGSREAGAAALTMRPLLGRAITLVEQAVARKGRIDGITTGLTELDALTGGFKAGEMVVLAARPSVGKTALALELARHNVKQRWDDDSQRLVTPGLPVGFFSLEMTAEQLMLRLLASEAEIDLTALRDGKLTDYALDKLAVTADAMQDWPLTVDESSFLTVNQLRARARRMKQQHGIQLLIVDYLQLLTGSRRDHDNRQVEVADISRGIKALAKELKVPIIVLAQLNRKPEEGGQEPALHHLRESGSIEQDADVVMLLSRLAEDERAGDIQRLRLNVAKQRNGPTDRLTVELVRSLTKFRDAAREGV